MIIGRVLKPRGLAGALRIQLFMPEPRLLAAGKIRLLPERGAPSISEITQLDWIDPRTAAVVLSGVRDRTTAEAVSGAAVEVELEWFVPGEEPAALLVGAELVDADSGHGYGTVSAVTHNGAQPVLVIGLEPDERMIPFVPAFVAGIERVGARRIIRVHPIPGLLDGL